MKKIVRIVLVCGVMLTLGISLLIPISSPFGFENEVVQAESGAVTITVDYFTMDYSDSNYPSGKVKEIHPSETITLRPGETVRLEPKEVAGYVAPSPKEINYNSYVYLFEKYGATVDNIGFQYEKQLASPVYNFTAEEAQAYIDTWKALQLILQSINTIDFSLYTDESINKEYAAGDFRGSIATTVDIRRGILTDVRPPTVEEVRQYSSNIFGGLAWAKMGMESDLSILKQALAGLEKKISAALPASSPVTIYYLDATKVNLEGEYDFLSKEEILAAQLVESVSVFSQYKKDKSEVLFNGSMWEAEDGYYQLDTDLKTIDGYRLKHWRLVGAQKGVGPVVGKYGHETTISEVTSVVLPGRGTSFYAVEAFYVPNSSTGKSIGFKNIYRLYDRTTNQHFYTSNSQEVNLLKSRGWRMEGTAWKVSTSTSGTAVYRVWNIKTGERIFTRHKSEVDRLVSRGWKNEGIAFYTQTSGQPIYRLRNKRTGRYLLTVGQAEVSKLVATGQWQNEGVAFYGVQ